MPLGKCTGNLVQVTSPSKEQPPFKATLFTLMGDRELIWNWKDFLLGKQLASVGTQAIWGQYRSSFLPRGLLST